jgi:hypothetical protein
VRQKRSFKEAQGRDSFLLYKVVQRALRVIDYYFPRSLKANTNDVFTKADEARIRKEFRKDNADLAKILFKDRSSLGD